MVSNPVIFLYSWVRQTTNFHTSFMAFNAYLSVPIGHLWMAIETLKFHFLPALDADFHH